MLPAANTTTRGSLASSAGALEMTLVSHLRRLRKVRLQLFNFIVEDDVGKARVLNEYFAPVFTEGGLTWTEIPTINSGKNDIEKTIIQKRNENQNENTFKNEK